MIITDEISFDYELLTPQVHENIAIIPINYSKLQIRHNNT